MNPRHVVRRDSLLPRRGSVFVVVLWIALALVTVALYFGQSSRWAYQASENALEGAQANQIIDGARRYITYVLNERISAGEMPDLDNADYLAEDVPVGDGRFWIVGRDANSDVMPDAPVWGLVDEASKVNLNAATQEMLESLPNMTSALAAAIIDWRDTDSDLTSEGAEAQEYETLDPAYSAKNGPFESVEELRLVKGFHLSVLWGEDANGNGALDANENDGDASPPDDDADGRLDPGLAEYVTVWSREPNTRADGSPKIDLQGTPARQQLQQLLEETFNASRAAQVMQRVGPRLQTLRSPIEFYLASGLSADEFARIEEALTVGGGAYRVGLVNVREASAAVLACLPGMDAGKAAALVTKRGNLDSTTLASTAWITAALDETTVRLIGPFITSRSYQFSADVVAVGANGRGLRRSFMVFDRESDARLIYRRDRARLGWPLGAETRATILARATGKP